MGEQDYVNNEPPVNTGGSFYPWGNCNAGAESSLRSASIPERFAGFERGIRGTFAAYKPWAYMTEPSRQQMLRHLRSRLPVALAVALETDRNPLGGREGILLCTG